MKEKNIKDGIMVIIEEVQGLHVQTIRKKLAGLKKSEDVLDYVLSLSVCIKKLKTMMNKLEDLAAIYADKEEKNETTKGNKNHD